MINETVRLLSAFLLDPQHGVNEMAQTLPRTALGGASADPAPPIVSVFNDVDTPSVATDLTAPQVPALVVWGDSDVETTYKGYKIARDVIIAVAYVTEDGVDNLVTNRDCGYILRGGILTFGRYNNQKLSEGYRELSGIRIMEVREVTGQRVTAAVGRQKMWGFLAVRVVAVETYS